MRPAEFRDVGDALYRMGCRNPYRAILSAAAVGLDPRDVERAYSARSEGETLRDEDKALLAHFDTLVKESTESIDALRPE